MKVFRISVTLALFLAALHAVADDSDRYTVDLRGAWTSLPGAGRIQGTNDHLSFARRFGSAAAVSMRVADGSTLEFAASDARMPSTLHAAGTATGRAIRFIPASLSLLRDLDNRWIVPYVGAGIEYPMLRRAVDVVSMPSLHIVRVEQPDHPALVLQTGARMSLGARWSVGVDAKYVPAASTFETRTTENRSDGLQTNFHPFVIATGLGVRF